MPVKSVEIQVNFTQDSSGRQKVKGTLNEIDAEVRRINRQTAENAKQTQRVITEAKRAAAKTELDIEKTLERSTKNRLRAQEAETKASLARIEAEIRGSASRSNSIFSSAFKGGLLGGLVGSVSAQLSQLPGMVSNTIDEMVRVAASRQNALKGLESISLFKGIDRNSVQEAVTGLRLVKAGIVDVAEASTAMKNLLSANFTLEESVTILERFSDTAAFGKSSALSFGEAIRSATEGVRNGNSTLVDNVGLTKNLSLILKEAGFAEQDLGRATSDAAVRRALYNGLIKESNAQLGDADKLTNTYTGSTAALDMAYQNLYASVGNVITQNPALLESNRLLTEQLDSHTKSVNKAGSDTAKFVNDSVTLYALLKASAISDIGAIVKMFGVSGQAIATTAGVMTVGMAAMVEGVIAPIDFAIKGIYNKIVQLNNLVHDAGLGGIFGVVGSGRMSEVENDLSNKFAITQHIARQLDQTLASMQNNLASANRMMAEGRAARAQIWAASQPKYGVNAYDAEDDYAAYRADRLPFGKESPKVPPPSDGGGRRGSSGGSGVKLGRGGQAMRDFFEDELNAVVTDFKRPAGTKTRFGTISKHGSWEAVDIRTRDRSIEEIFQITARGIEKGYRLFDERNTAKPHQHWEANSRRASGFLSASMYGGPDKLAYLQMLDAKRLGRGGVSSEELERFNAGVSDQITKAERDKNIRTVIDLYKAFGLIPTGRVLDEIRGLMVQEARSAGKRQPGESDVRGLFLQSQHARAVPIDMPTTAIGSSIHGPAAELTLGQQYVENLKAELGLKQGINGEESRYYRLLIARANVEEEIGLRLENQQLAREETLHNLQIEFELLRRMNINAEAELRNSEEKVGLAQELRDLQIQLMNFGRNDPLMRQVEQLREMLSIEQSRVRLRDAMEISETKIRAGLYGHLAVQRTLNEGIIDGINGTYDAILRRMNEPMDRLNERAGGLFSFITEPVKAMQAQGLNAIFDPVIDKLFPGAMEAKNPELAEAKRQTALLEKISVNTGGLPIGYNPTSGIGNIVSAFTGSGVGPGGTANFNPNASGAGIPGGLMQGGYGGGGSDPLAMAQSQAKAAAQVFPSLLQLAGGVVPGRAGRMLKGAGMGMQIGMMFGPMGSMIGTGIGALIGLFGGGGDNAIKKLKEAAAAEYGITIKDKQILNSLKQVGELYFGKGKAGANAPQVVKTDEAREIIKNYAEATGQTSQKIRTLHYGDENWEGNQFRGRFGGFRAMGGPVSAGMAYIVGERRPEVFVPHTNGTIMPAVPSVSTNDAMMQRMMTILAQLEETNMQLASRLESVSPGQILRMGARENPEAIGDGYLAALERRPQTTEEQLRRTGVYD
jgi:hypothetical protein